MSRVAKSPITLPKGVEVKINGQQVAVKGGKGSLELNAHDMVEVQLDGDTVTVRPKQEGEQNAWAHAGTVRALLGNMVKGVSEGFEQKLELVGVGYRAQAQGKVLNLSLGFSHPVAFELPEGITAETPTQTEVVIRGVDKQLVGQVAANVRGFRPPEPYKGKGIRYAGEQVRRKEAKKK